MSLFSVVEFDKEAGRIIFSIPEFDFDSFEVIGKQLVNAMDAKITEQQIDADLHSWLIDFEGAQFMLRAEHYSNSVWLEALARTESQDELTFIAGLF
ncbi:MULTISPECIES: DUF3630 family protein [unclassified Aliivibrio]|jgi:hypothetical protein|uniref:DUF3630 family protein n=1 Tax=unclassified Aliivibrio TaxID=2645654 RepID=UPI00080EBA3C|nr:MULTISPECIES: DUF3630 family protein [unclassified Aliivibrio]OCH12018.1 aminopeptidase [Aliivibrio sp. 1S165]OCH25418.1 aminopeptidase [Aliivibrio sp. 1S128]OCH35944.1 aminopeptidase [Aliivibrio sp. 1S175]